MTTVKNLRKEPRTVSEKPFLFGCSTVVFPAEEIDALIAAGSKLEALAEGILLPSTPEDEHFLRVHSGQAEARSLLEKAWVRLKGRREYEREQAGKTAEAPADPEVYGMVEWDADRCWW